MEIPINHSSGDVGEFFQKAFFRCPVAQNLPWQTVAPVLGIAYCFFCHRADGFPFRDETANEAVMALVRSAFAGGVRVRKEDFRLFRCKRRDEFGELGSVIGSDGLEFLGKLGSVLLAQCCECLRDGFAVLAIDSYDDFQAGLSFGECHQSFVLAFLPDDGVDLPMAEFFSLFDGSRALFNTPAKDTLVHTDSSLFRYETNFQGKIDVFDADVSKLDVVVKRFCAHPGFVELPVQGGETADRVR